MTTRAKCVRFEIEYEDGRVVRAASPEAAERHHRDLDSACGIAHAHGWAPAAPPEFETVRASRSPSGSGEREAANPHVMECNYRLGPIGAPGCICRVVNRALSSGERVRALEEALREAVTLLSGPLTVLHRVHTPSFWICTCEAEADSDYPTGKPCSCPRPEAKSGCVDDCPACAATAARSAFVERVRRALSSAPPSPDSGERVRAPSPHSEAESGPQWMPGGAFCSCGEVEFLVPGTATVRTSTRGVALPTVHTPTECRSATWDEVSNLSAPVPAESATTAKCANRSGQGEEDGR